MKLGINYVTREKAGESRSEMEIDVHLMRMVTQLGALYLVFWRLRVQCVIGVGKTVVSSSAFGRLASRRFSDSSCGVRQKALFEGE